MKKLKNIICHIKTMAYNLVGGQLRKKQLTTFDKPSILRKICMVFDKNFRKGGKAEYLTQVYLTAFGFSNPTYRQEDFGIDFTCVLTDEKKNKLYPTEPFNLQVKSHKEKELQVLKFKKKNSQDLDWLFKNPNPYILAWIDFENTKDIYFYSLSTLWYIDIAKIEYGCLEFKYDTELSDGLNVNDYKPNSIVVDTHFINLGKPFMTMSLDDLKNDDIISKKREILKYVVKLEKENIQYRCFGIPFMKWLWKFKTNDLSSFVEGWSHFCNNDIHKEINQPSEIIENIGHILITLASSFALHNKNGKNEQYSKHYNALIELIKELPKEKFNNILSDLNFIDKNGKFFEKQVKFPSESMGPTGHSKQQNYEILIPEILKEQPKYNKPTKKK